ncbi:MAG: hypothetical protein ABJC05_08850 [Pyrinomonadaceae bacterium]
MKNRDCRNTLLEIDSNEPAQRLSEKSVAHIAHCSSCREASDQGSSLRQLIAGFETVSAPPDFDMRLRARLASERKPVVAWINLLRQAPGASAFALAFSLLVIGTLAFYLRPPGTQEVAGTRERPGQSSGKTNGTSGAIPAATSASNELVSGAPAGSVQTSGQTGGSNQTIPATASRETASTSRRAGRPGADLNTVTNGSDITSREFSQLPASIIKRPSDTEPGMSPVVSLSAPAQPVVVSMRDDHGATRTISLPPVSFGSQRLVQRGYQPASLISSAKGVW